MMSDAMGPPLGINGGDENFGIVPFEKYRGRSVAELAADRDYSEWLMGQP
jgi:hypothetical protein